MSKGITKRKESFAKWYTDLITKADLAEHSAVRGCMVIKPYGFGIWEKIQSILDNMFKETGHTNAYFPLFSPKSFLSKEADHVEGFAKECAVVTHYRLKNDENGKGIVVDPKARLDEELIVRPTSETIIWNSYRNWIRSYRDLPLLINQWANVVRWELRPRLFLRTAEFLWQEGHTAHATRDEAIKEAETMLKVYADFAENYMAIPVIQGTKTENEKFAGAIETYCIEALMQDGKALQAGTSHFLGQNFAKAFDVKFSNKEGTLEHVWATSWGVSTRLMGALIMTHSDDNGLIIPPKLAPIQVVIVPIYKGDDELNKIREVADRLISDLKSIGVRIVFDDDDTKKPGWKFAEHELKGVPLRIALGPRDLKNNTVEVSRRDLLQKESISQSDLNKYIPDQLSKIQKNLFERAKTFRGNNTHHANSYDEFKEILENKGGFIYAHWDGTPETELKIKEETKASIRAIPFDKNPDTGLCIYTGKPSKRKVIFAKAY